MFDTPPPGPGETSKPIHLSVGTVDLKDADIGYRGPAVDRPLNLGLQSLRIESDAADMLDFDLAGTLGEVTVEATGTTDALLAPELLDVDVQATSTPTWRRWPRWPASRVPLIGPGRSPDTCGGRASRSVSTASS